MKQKVLAASILSSALFLWTIQPSAQNTPAKTAQNQSGQKPADAGTPAEATPDRCERMTDLIEQIATYQQQMTVTVNKLKQNASDLQNEKEVDPMRSRLAEQSGMLDVLQIYLTQQGRLTQSMTEELQNECPSPNEKLSLQ